MGGIQFPPGPYGHMMHFATWRRFIERSNGSAHMKRTIIDYIDDHVREGDLIDAFKTGFALGAFSDTLSAPAHRDFLATIALTRDLNNVPIVQVNGRPVS